MRIAITGCAGSVGKRVVIRALAQGHTVLGLDRVPDHPGPPTECFEYRQLDVRDFQSTLDALRCCDAAVHLAAHSNPADYLVQSHNEYVIAAAACN
ncbi:hypothetical protein K488DRAFT_56709 [Vararia minispora EC-137]|uniref:Uncharacterized protein n=1 Tax=Vararia minispora EC-137 TaxID=1314806 RepID=A0ACB8QBR9_9AGAM|nr:hypothetical protein K488DRAFT_56709 [Vararia minispora EC-137]